MNVPPRVVIDWRKPGGRKPDGVIVCSRPSRWGNPWRVVEFRWDYGRKIGYRVVDELGLAVEETATSDKELAVAFCLDLYRRWITEELRRDPTFLDPLRTATGLACWCSLDQKCHVDVIREVIATSPASA